MALQFRTRYLGRLAYVTHDADREQPVHFQWQLIDDWPPPSAVLTRMGLQLVEAQPSAVAPPLDVVTASGTRGDATAAGTTSYWQPHRGVPSSEGAGSFSAGQAESGSGRGRGVGRCRF